MHADKWQSLGLTFWRVRSLGAEPKDTTLCMTHFQGPGYMMQWCHGVLDEVHQQWLDKVQQACQLTQITKGGTGPCLQVIWGDYKDHIAYEIWPEAQVLHAQEPKQYMQDVAAKKELWQALQTFIKAHQVSSE